MATSQYFKHGTASEQAILEDVVVESIKMRGMDVLYIPRTVVDVNEFFSEDRFSTFDEVFTVEMYPINQEGYEGQGDLLSKFGIQVDQTGTFIVARKRWLAEVGTKTFSGQLENRPAEGDLLYYPLSKSLFKINHVEQYSPFYQLSSRYVWSLKVSLIDFTYHEMNTGNDEVDDIFNDIKGEVIDNIAPEEDQRRYKGHNDDMVEKGNTIIDWNSSNPFGE